MSDCLISKLFRNIKQIDLLDFVHNFVDINAFGVSMLFVVTVSASIQ